MGLRAHDGIPEWISHVAFVDGTSNTVRTGPKDAFLIQQKWSQDATDVQKQSHLGTKKEREDVIVDLRNVCVTYSGRKVFIPSNKAF